MISQPGQTYRISDWRAQARKFAGAGISQRSFRLPGHVEQAVPSRRHQPATGSSRPAAVYQNGVTGRAVHPIEPLAVRLTIAGAF